MAGQPSGKASKKSMMKAALSSRMSSLQAKRRKLNPKPTFEELAQTAGVTVRSVYRHMQSQRTGQPACTTPSKRRAPVERSVEPPPGGWVHDAVSKPVSKRAHAEEPEPPKSTSAEPPAKRTRTTEEPPKNTSADLTERASEGGSQD